MEEKYTFEQKQLVIHDMVKKKIFKQHIIHLYQNIKLKEVNDTCFFCEQAINNLSTTYCSILCKNIFESNLFYKIKNKLNINCIPISLLTKESRIKFKKIINKYRNIVYDKTNIFYNVDTSYLKFNNFKKIFLSIIFIHKYKKIATENIILELNLFKINSNIYFKNIFIHSSNIIKYITPNLNDNIPNNCLYCNKDINSNNCYYVYITNQYILGRFCSVFCSKVYLSIYEQHIRQPYKFFLILPPVCVFKDLNLINNFKKKNNTIYNTSYNKNNLDITEIIY